jgi:uncharacterized membrane protein
MQYQALTSLSLWWKIVPNAKYVVSLLIHLKGKGEKLLRASKGFWKNRTI